MGKQDTALKRDREITRYIHRLFWHANFIDKLGLIFFLTRVPASLIYNVMIPIQIAYGIQAIVTDNFNAVNNYAYTIIILAVIYCALWIIGGIAISHNGIIGASYIQKTIFSNYLNKDYEFYSNSYLGALGAQAARLRDAYNEYNQIVVNGTIRQVTIIGAGVIIIGYQSVQLAIITIVCMGLVLSHTLLSSQWRLRYRRNLSMRSSELAGVIGDALGQGMTVKSFASEAYEEKILENKLLPWGKAQYQSWISSIPADIGRMILAAITTAVLLIYTAKLYQQREISIAIVALVQLYVIKMIAATQDIAELIRSYESTMGGAYQAVKTMMVEPTIKDPVKPINVPRSKHYEINFMNVTFRYENTPKSRAAVNKFNLVIKGGEKVGIVGYSGSGKTTLTKLVLRFIDTSDGSISINGVNIRDISQKKLRKLIAYVPQEPLLFHRTILDNIYYGRPGTSRQDVIKSAHTAYVDEFVENLPNSYDTFVGERGIKLSGGQRQRVAIARALVKDAPILVLDEATSALDSRSEKYIQQGLWKLIENRTALVIAHRLSTIQRLDKIVVMDKGRIVQIGTHEELLKKKGIYADLWAHQSGGYIGLNDNNEE